MREPPPPRLRAWLVVYLLVRAGAVTVFGAFLLLRPHDTVDALATLAGMVLIAFGIVDVAAAVPAWLGARRRLIGARGLVTVLIGLVAVLLTDVAVTTLAILLGMHLVLSGGIGLAVGLSLRKGIAAWWGVALRSSLWVVAGLVTVLWPRISIGALAVLYGLQWIFGGLLSAATAGAIALRQRPPA